MSRLTPRKGMPSPRLNEGEFRKRFLAQFQDRAFDSLASELDSIATAAWDAYSHSRKAPRTRKAGAEFADPDYDLSVDWLAARAAIADAQRRHDDRSKPAILLINCSSRSEHTCPGEMSKSYRLVEIAREVFAAAPSVAIELLDLSRLASEYGRHIHPCKACFSTAAALCHWPCSCYPNHSLGQTQDWMNEIYPMWVAAHGIMIITPVNWYQVSSPLKLMMDRLVCADGGNPDPTRTQGKNAELAKRIELEGWDYPRHLAGRLFSVVVCMGTSRASRTSDGAFPIGFASCSCVRPVRWRSSIATSVIGSPTPPATPISTPIPPFKRRCATPLALCSRRCAPSSKASW
jgi:multimeric flavodoxin WrbA